MLIFYAWVVFLVAILLSVPIVYMVETSRNKKDQPVVETGGDEFAEGEDEPLQDEAGEEIPDEMAGFEGEIAPGEDDFSAFEEEFK